MNKINSLETLRGFAALIVALYHLPGISLFHIDKGFIAVYFFFTLSGFVISLNYLKKITDFNSLIKFKKKRFLRLYPVHLFVLLLVLFIQILKIYALEHLDISYEQKAFEPSNWYTIKDFFQHLFLLQSVTNFGYHLSWNAAAWTISTEFYTYLVFALTIILLKNNEFYLTIVILIYIIFFNKISDFLIPYINYLLLDCLRYFLAGSLMFLIYKNFKILLNDITFIILLSVLILLYNYIPNYILFSAFVLIAASQSKSNLILKFLNFRPFVYFGTISYSFYMIHHVIFYLFNQSLKLININFYNTKDQTNYIFFHDLLFTLIYIILGTSFSVLMYKFIENKFRSK